MTSRSHLVIALVTGLLAGCDSSSTDDVMLDSGSGSIEFSARDGQNLPVDGSGRSVEPLITDSFSGPIPTSDWWSSLVWPFTSPYSEDLYAHPLVFRADSAGLSIRYPTEIIPGDSAYFFSRVEDLHAGPGGTVFPDTRVDGHGDWTVRAEWSTETVEMQATFGHGLPFVYMAVSGAPLTVLASGEASVWFREGPVVGMTVNGHFYGIYAPDGQSWSIQGNDHLLVSSDPDGGYYSIAILPDSSGSTLDRFGEAAYSFVEDSRISWAYDQAAAVVRTTFELTTRNVADPRAPAPAPISALYPHQWMYLTGQTEPDGYVSPRGPMHLVQSERFVVEVPYTGVLPNIPAAPGDTSGLRIVVDLLESEAESDSFFDGALGRGDTYWTGKALGRLAELAGIAHEVEQPTLRDRFLDVIQDRLEAWFVGDGSAGYFYYDSNWNTLIGYPDSYGSATDLNDHHFHYGYFISAAATLVRHRPEWARAWGPMVELMIADVANSDRSNPNFPFLRTFDPYAGHSWASGHGGFNRDGNNQESSSEAMNFAYGVIRWGQETGNQTLRDVGVYLHTTEKTAVEQYWFDVENHVFPESFKHTNVAMVWGNGGQYGTWFGDQTPFVHGINVLPVTGGSFYLGLRPGYVARNVAEYEAGKTSDLWADVMWSFGALSDPMSYWNAYLRQRLLYTPEEGLSRAQTYQWMRLLNRVGRVDSAVRADVPGFMVFEKDGVHTYYAYNESREGRFVHFSDGTSFPVQAQTLMSLQRRSGVDHTGLND